MNQLKESSQTGQAPGATPTQDFTDEIRHEQARERKRFNTLQARAALAGHSLTAVSSGYMLSRWSHSKHCGELDTVEDFLSRMGAKP